jgi:hypothetical protein
VAWRRREGGAAMIVILTTRGHGYTFRSLQRGAHGLAIPAIRTVPYERMLRTGRVERATYVFCDLERLSAWELQAVAELHHVMTRAGLRCLNDPVQAKSRVELLRTLHREGVNTFNVYRADEAPRPARFPVFVRSETDHARPLTGLLPDQRSLDVWLGILRDNRVPPRGLIVVEYCGEPYRANLWHKWSTFRIADRIWLDHIAVDDSWSVKHGDWHKLTDEIVAQEHEAVVKNRFADDMRKAFDLAGIELGRADHALVAGRTAVYEINTNPYIGPFVPDPKPLRLSTQRLARQRLAEALAAIDCPQSGSVRLDATPPLRRWRTWTLTFAPPRRP